MPDGMRMVLPGSITMTWHYDGENTMIEGVVPAPVQNEKSVRVCV